MQELDDRALLAEYVERNSEAAFSDLVARHVNMVYSTALRRTGNADSAEEITQAVFVILARKSGGLRGHVFLSGWLYETARLTAQTFVRSAIRRARREEEAAVQDLTNDAAPEAWREIGPLLDEAMARLKTADRQAVVLRFFEGKSLKEVGMALGANEEAAKKRVSRALERLRAFFMRRGVKSTTVIIAGVISSNAVQAAPPGVATSAALLAVAKGVAAAGPTLALAQGTMKLMTWLTLKSAALTGAGCLLALTVATVAVKTALAANAAEGAQARLSYTVEGRVSYTTFPTPMTQADMDRLLNTLPPGFQAQRAQLAASLTKTNVFESTFVLNYRDGRWNITTKPVGDSNRVMTVFSYDGTNLLDYIVPNTNQMLQSMQVNAEGSDTKPMRIIWSGSLDATPMPSADASGAMAVWFALASEAYFATLTNGRVSTRLTSRYYHLEEECTHTESAEAPHLPMLVEYQRGSNSLVDALGKAVAPAPNSPVQMPYIARKFVAAGSTNVGGLTFPMTYGLEEFAPDNNTSNQQIRLMFKMSGETTSIQPGPWKWENPANSQTIYIQDRRLDEEGVQYMLTNGVIPEVDSEEVQQTLRWTQQNHAIQSQMMRRTNQAAGQSPGSR